MNLTRRERVLGLIVGVTVAILLNLFLFSYFTKNRLRLVRDYGAKQADLNAKKILLAEKDIWAQRDAWLQSKLPKLVNETRAGVDLLNEIEALAKKHTITPEGATIGTPDNKRPGGGAGLMKVPSTVSFGTKSSWPSLVAFLRDMQGPEKFIVFENATIEVDKSDKTQMHGQFRVAKWFAP